MKQFDLDSLERREFLRSSIVLPSTLALMLLVDEDDEAEAGIFLQFVGALIVTEVILGVLRAYDIDIASSVENFVRGHKNNSYPRYAKGYGSPDYERQISQRGSCNTGNCQVGEFGYTTQFTKNTTKPIWTPAINMWAGTGEMNLSEGQNLIHTRSGYPVDVTKKESKSGPNGGYSILKQNFQKGNTKIIVDHSMPEDIKNIYLRNKDERVWFS